MLETFLIYAGGVATGIVFTWGIQKALFELKYSEFYDDLEPHIARLEQSANELDALNKKLREATDAD